MIEWLLQPIDPERVHDVSFVVAWHGRAMVLAWSFFFPIGVLLARFLKITANQDWPRELDNKFWWKSHLVFQISGGVIMLIGSALILFKAESTTDLTSHNYLGWFLIVFGCLHMLSGKFRGSKGGPTAPAPDGSLHGDHYDMTFRRKCFEYYHKYVGYILLWTSVIAVITGMWIANGPIWMWLGMACWWSLIMVCFYILQSRGMAIDTYQAIWGPNPEMPGSDLKPIGWKVRKLK